MLDLLTFDLGGTRLKAGVVPHDSPTAADLIIREATTTDLPALIRSVGEEALAGRTPAGVGLAVPGLIDDRGIIVSLPGKHAGIEGVDLPALLHEMFGCTAVVLNDAIAYGLGEATAGSGMGCARVVVVTLGTGVGVTVIENGAPLGAGAFGGGLMGGMIPISDVDDGPLDTNGGHDTIEAFCRAERLVHDSGAAYASVPEVYDGWARGEDAARRGVARYRSSLVRALVALASAHAPDRIVIGGGPVTADGPLLRGVEDEVNARLFGSYRVDVRAAALGDGAALAGLAHRLRTVRA